MSPRHVVDAEAVVDLDQVAPDPAVTAWGGLVERGDAETYIVHGGDASKLIGFPRPSWASPHYDTVGAVPAQTGYRSDRVAVAASLATCSRGDGGEVALAHASARAKVNQIGQQLVQVSLHQRMPDRVLALTFTCDEARRLAQVLMAAADLAERP